MYRYIIIFLLISTINCDVPEVNIPQGKITPLVRTNIDGGSYYAFRKIPFGKPPIGELRFKAPEPAESWEGTLDSTDDVPACIHDRVTGLSRAVEGQEDCLYLNLYTPGIPSENVTNLPVMVYIYGGTFKGGSAHETEYGANFLLTKDVILVVVNYRVALFGFLSLDDSTLGVTGNAGLKDQSLALKWVHDNVAYFGGNPDNILIFGQSAGGMSVSHQVLSPMSKGLFKKAISQSGVSLTDFTTPAFRNNFLVLADYVGVPTDDYADMIKTFQEMDAIELTQIGAELINKWRYFCRPIVEIPNDNAFMYELPIDVIRSGNYNQIIFMTGFTDAEAKGELEIVEDFTAYIPEEFQIDHDSEEAALIGERIKIQYYKDEEPTADNPAPAIYLQTDFGSGFPAFRTAVEMLKTAIQPIYFYLFSVDTTLNKSYINGRSSFPGAAHMDDLSYLFYSSETPEVIEPGSVEELNLRNIINLWTNFAIYDTPTPDGFAYKWDPVTAEQFNYLHIDTESWTPKVDPKPSEFQFWTELYDEYFPNMSE